MHKQSFNTNWFFHNKTTSPGEPPLGPITLPHDAMLHEPRQPRSKNGFNTGYFPGGDYRYSKTIFLDHELQNKNVVFEFEGVYMDSQVFINGLRAGGHPYGYSNFYITADNFLKYGQDNEIVVLVHNQHEPNSRWYSGSGIYRNVNMFVGEPLHILPNGLKVTTMNVQPHQAALEVATSIINNAQDSTSVTLVLELHRKDGELVATDEVPATLRPNETATLKRTLAVPGPALWSLDHPNLYTCSAKIILAGIVLDQGEATFGIRTLELDSKNGLRLNGAMIKLRGGCVHHDNGVIGACTLAAAEDRRVRLLKASGFNALRSAHNPMSKAMLDACDRHGMLVMDEFSDVWFRKKTRYDYSQYFPDWWESDLQAMLDKDYNHPCVILYSIGNEISETATPEGVAYSRGLAEKVKSLDPTRFVINNINGWLSYLTSLRARVGRMRTAENISASVALNPVVRLMNMFMDFLISLPAIDRCTKDAYATVDIAGYNYMTGRYEQDGDRYPQRLICGSETFPPEIAKNWRLVKKLPYVIGDFSWTAWDYLGEAGLCTWQYGHNQSLLKPYPCILADSPIIDITGHRQAQSYIHEIVWGLRTDPFIAVQPVNHAGESLSKSVWRGTNAIDSWTWDGYEGHRAIAEVYAAADQVELFLNGQSLGTKPCGERHNFKALFKTVYQPGELTAHAYAKDGSELGRTTLRTASPQLQLRALPEASTLKANGADLAYINILLTDENGIVKPLADRLVTVDVEGAGSLLGFGSADPFTVERFTDNQHTTYQGRALAVVRAGLQPGTVKVTLSTADCKPQTLTLPVEAL